MAEIRFGTYRAKAKAAELGYVANSSTRKRAMLSFNVEGKSVTIDLTKEELDRIKQINL